jgi:hypothetical protein
MKRLLLMVFCAALLLAVLPVSAVGTQCLVGTAVVTNGSEDETVDVSVGLVWGIGENLIFGPLGEKKEVKPGDEVVIRSPETEVPLNAAFVDMYPSDTLFAGIWDSSVAPCASSGSGSSSGLPAFHDGRLVQAPWASATLYQTQADSYAVWGIDAAGGGYPAFSFTCDEAQTRLRQALDRGSAGENVLLFDYPVPARNGSIQIWGVPGSAQVQLVLISTGQGADNRKNTIVPLPELCPALHV